MLVTADVEHRIITKHTQSFIEKQWQLVCENSLSVTQTLCALFEPFVSSLINSVFDTSVTADISFLTDQDWKSFDAPSNNVDPLVSGFSQIYLTVKYI
jgi:hypothetical protein